MVEMEWVFVGCICCPPGCVPLHPSHFLASQQDQWASSYFQTLPFRFSAAALSTTHDSAVCLGIEVIGHPQMKVLSLFTHPYVF